MASSAYTIDAGGLFARTKKLYRNLVAVEEKSEDQARLARSMISQAKTAPNLSEVDLSKIAEATELMVTVDGLLMQARESRLKLLAHTVNGLGSTLARVRGYRAQVSLGEQGLKQLDADLENITLRYENVYRPMFPVLAGGIVQMPDPREMTEQAWEHVENNLEGPLFFWDYNACQDFWSDIHAPSCTGPDYLFALSLINQVIVALEHELEMRREFWIIAAIDDGLFDGALEEQDQVFAKIERAAEDIAGILADIFAILKGITGALRKTPGVVLLALGVGVFILSRKK